MRATHNGRWTAGIRSDGGKTEGARKEKRGDDRDLKRESPTRRRSIVKVEETHQNRIGAEEGEFNGNLNW